MKKIMSSKQYVKDGGSRCPICKSKNITGGDFQADSSVVWNYVSCEDCSALWQDVYTLTGYDNLKKGN